MKLLRCWSLVFILTASSVSAQDADSLLTTNENILSAEDSLSIFSLFDSLIRLDESLGSQLALRLSYNSNVLSAGRTLGIENFGISPGVSYYHKTGLYADVSGYWSKDFEPSYYLTVASLGCIHDFSKRFSIMGGYDRYFYRIADADSYIPYRNTLSVTPILELKPVSISTNYSFYFGDQRVHRLMPGISVTFTKKNFLQLERLSITPSFFALWGNEIITQYEIVFPKSREEAVANWRAYRTVYRVDTINKNVHGIMNYTLTLPLSISHKNWSFTFTYAYNIPKALPEEPLTLSESTYLSGSLIYLINLKRPKNTL
jgi:hypothetical protein